VNNLMDKKMRKNCLTPPENLKLTQGGRSKSKCESCINAVDCKLLMPSLCGEYCPALGYFGAIQFDAEITKPDIKRVI